jgi:hypothetical protein
MDAWEPAAFDRSVDDDTGGPGRAGVTELRAMIEAAELILAERGAPPDARLGAAAKKIVLAWAASNETTRSDALIDVFDIKSPGALREASLRARSFVRDDRDCSAVLMKVLDLVAGGWDNTGLTRVVPYNAARAAS